MAIFAFAAIYFSTFTSGDSDFNVSRTLSTVIIFIYLHVADLFIGIKFLSGEFFFSLCITPVSVATMIFFDSVSLARLIIASVDKGIYAVNFAGGQVDITSGKFVFSTSEAYLIENGKVTRPLSEAVPKSERMVPIPSSAPTSKVVP